jgi:hypothetical protein
MATANKKKMGAGTQGKGSGTGALTERATGGIGENDVLSNRDKKQHSRVQGQDSKAIQVEQLQDTESNQGGE